MSDQRRAALPPRAGYTLPVFACASAIAALRQLLDPTQPVTSVNLWLVRPDQTTEIPIEQVACLPDGQSALAITRSDPGDNLDLTRYTPVWALVAWGSTDPSQPVQLLGGEGVGKHLANPEQPAIYRYATDLLQANLLPLLPDDRTIRVTILLPEGRSLAQRTSNAAFGIVDGLSLLGTSGIAQPLSAPGQLEQLRHQVRSQATQLDQLVFCIGENGLQRALSLGIPPEQRVKTANWLGPLLVEAALAGVQSIVLLGYHGKLIKLAGGIFHTHHHVADGRQEILAAIAAAEGLPTPDVQTLLRADTVEAGLQHLRQLDQIQGSQWVDRIYATLVERIDTRAIAYIQTHSDRRLQVGSIVFDRQRQLIAISPQGQALLPGV